MRGARFTILLLIAIPLGWYRTYDSKRAGRRHDQARQGVHRRRRQDRRDRNQIRVWRRTTLRKKGSDWEIVQPITAPTDQGAVSGITSNLER